jgi:predicted nucleic acid-binding protein
MKPLRLYLDTSVFGGCFDAEFEKESNALFRLAKQGKFALLVSDLVLAELVPAPKEIRDFAASIVDLDVEALVSTAESEKLARAYLSAGILTKKSETDAEHVALATVTRADAIVSWNFKHVVQLQKMKQFNQINLSQGYGFLQIVTPKEVLPHD